MTTGYEEEVEVVDVSGDSTALAALNRSEIDMQISTAKRYPRSIALAKRRMIEMATIDKETAERCGYALKRTDKDGKIAWIEGPSIRMAEIAVSCWGNVRYGARVIEETDRFIVAQGVCHDLETNVYNAIEVRRRITGRNGRKYGDDMVGVTANAASSIAARNAVFKVIPRAIIDAAYDAAMKTASGDEKTFTQRRGNALAAFTKLGVKIEEVMAVLGKANGGIEDVDTTDLRRLHGLLTAIQDGETSVDQVFRHQHDNASTEKTDALNDKLKVPPAPTKPAKEQGAGELSPASQGVPPGNDPGTPAPPSEADIPGDDEPPVDTVNEALDRDASDYRATLVDALKGAGTGDVMAGRAIDGWFKLLGGPKADGNTIPLAKRRELYDAIKAGRVKVSNTGVMRYEPA